MFVGILLQCHACHNTIVAICVILTMFTQYKKHVSSDILAKSILSIGENKSFKVPKMRTKGSNHQKQMPHNTTHDDNSKNINIFHFMNGITHKKPIVKIS